METVGGETGQMKSNRSAGFSINLPATRVVMRPGASAHAADEVERLGACRALVLSTPPQARVAREMAEVLCARAVGVFTQATAHTPVAVTEAAIKVVEDLRVDCLVALGGGSTIGLGKAIALRTGLPQIAIPTTYAGSEATPIVGQTENGVKTTIRDPKLRPATVIYDPELLVTLPVAASVASALNAMAHAVEALYARDLDPLSKDMATRGVTILAEGLPRVVAAPLDVAARTDTLYGAWLCGFVLGQVGMALHHKLCHVLGGAFDMPHAQTHAVVLPHAVAYNEPCARAALRPVADALGGEAAGRALHSFASRIGAPQSLRGLGLAESDLDRAAALALETPYWNPRAVEKEAIRDLLQAAWEGAPPAA